MNGHEPEIVRLSGSNGTSLNPALSQTGRRNQGRQIPPLGFELGRQFSTKDWFCKCPANHLETKLGVNLKWGRLLELDVVPLPRIFLMPFIWNASNC